MFKLFFKIFKTKKNLVYLNNDEKSDIFLVGQEIKVKVKKLFKGSLAIRQIDAGSDNACEQELMALSNGFYDIERFGIHFVASPRHADMLLITGPVTRNMAKAVKDAYDATPNPKIVVAVGDDAISGGLFAGSYAISGGVDSVLPVNYCIPGDPPTPKEIIIGLLKIINEVDIKKSEL
ncbi:hypothetical protein GW758_03550 [Candidatus Falkowbacteria bacterium]|nr:hypothetical protein [Candidatus Falkowbacteria bacterium]